MYLEAIPSIPTSPQTPLYESIKHEEEQDLPSSNPLTNTSTALQSFTLFSLLPPELRILILHHALSNCYVTYQRIKSRRSFNDSMTHSTPSGSSSATNTQYTYTHRLDKHKWMRLMLSCRMACELAKDADEKLRKEVGTKEYWIYGRKWDEMVDFYREGGGSFDGDPEFRW